MLETPRTLKNPILSENGVHFTNNSPYRQKYIPRLFRSLRATPNSVKHNCCVNFVAGLNRRTEMELRLNSTTISAWIHQE